MTIAERTATAATAVEAAAADVSRQLESKLRPLFLEALARDSESLVSVTIPLVSVDAIGLFAAAQQLGADPSLWLQPDEGFALLALDVAWRIRASGTDRFEAVAAAWSALQAGALISDGDAGRGAGPLLIGGLGFSPERAKSSAWIGFEAADMVLPRLLVTVTASGTWLTVSAVVAGSDPHAEAAGSTNAAAAGSTNAAVATEPAAATRVAEAMDAAAAASAAWQELLHTALSRPTASPSGDILRIASYRPEAPEWRATVARFAGAVGRGRIDKVVLARQIDVTSDLPFDVGALVERLAASAPESTVFAVSRGGRTFVGATPERLMQLDGLDFQTVALAGSTRRALDPEDDARLAAELLASDKEREEHAVVVRMLRDTLAPMAASLTIPDAPSVRRLRHVQHLSTDVCGSLREPMGILALVSRLHPTPAVGGAPRDLALELIAEEERQERGWYAGPLGWLDRRGDGEFVVALRCGMVGGSRATLFAGCGIVADSDPDREWDESLIKLRAFGSALGRIEA